MKNTVHNKTAIRVAMSGFFFVSGFNFATWASRIPTIQHLFHLNEAQVGNILFAMPLGLIATLPLTSYLLSRFSNRNIMFIGALLFTWVLPWITFVNATWQLAVILFIFGSSRNLMNIALNAQSVQVQKLYDKSILTTFHGLWSLAGFAGAALCTAMTFYGSSLFTHFITVSIFLTVIICTAFFYTLPNNAVEQEKRPAFAFPNKSLMKVGLVCFCSLSCEGVMLDWIGIYFHDAVKVSPALVNCGYIAYMFAMTSSRFMGDRLINQYGIFKVLRISGILMASGLLITAALPHIVTASIGCILVGIGVACVTPLAFSLAGKNKSMATGSAIAAVSTLGYFGFLAGPPVIGYIAHTIGIRWAFILFSLLGIGVVILAKRLKHT